MSGINKVILIGNLGRDPELRYTPAGVAVTTFSIATSETWKDKDSGEKKESTEWHKIVVWRKLAEICGEYLVKGSKVYIEGKLQTRDWQDKNHKDITHYTTEIIAREVQFLTPKSGGGSYGGHPPGQGPAHGPEQGKAHNGPDDDDIPF